jgi:outer membrane receptor protein involved in Fe transport
MLYGRMSLSAGGSAFETDGFRHNNDDKTKLADVYGQIAITPKISLQTEYRYRDTDHGDLALEFDPLDPATFSLVQRRDIDQDVLRVGLRVSPAPHSDIILSGFYTKRDENVALVPGTLEDDLHEKGPQGEAQYLFRGGGWDAILGGGYYDIDRDEVILRPSGTSRLDSPRQQVSGYAYTTFALPQSVRWTLGLGYDDFEQAPLEVNEWTPKAGLVWEIADWLYLRAAAIKTVKRALIVDQTIEPTQIAGFNQFYDDLNGTVAKLYGVALDSRITEKLYGGLEVTHRILDHPSGEMFEDRRETTYRGYLYRTIGLRWALTLEALFDRFDSEPGNNPNVPLRLDTIYVPISLRYFDPSGMFVAGRASFVNQDVEIGSQSSLPDGSDNEGLLDAAIGFRLPNRLGILSIEVNNILDTKVKFQDENFRSSRESARNTRFFPDRTILARATLSF